LSRPQLGPVWLVPAGLFSYGGQINRYPLVIPGIIPGGAVLIGYLYPQGFPTMPPVIHMTNYHTRIYACAIINPAGHPGGVAGKIGGGADPWASPMRKHKNLPTPARMGHPGVRYNVYAMSAYFVGNWVTCMVFPATP